MAAVRLSRLAAADLHAADAYYLAAKRSFLDEVARQLDLVGANPRVGSSALASVLGIPGLRFRPITGFPYLILYAVVDDVAVVGRVLHTRRDLGALVDIGAWSEVVADALDG